MEVFIPRHGLEELIILKLLIAVQREAGADLAFCPNIKKLHDNSLEATHL